MEDPVMLWKAFERSGSPEIYLQYRQAADRLSLRCGLPSVAVGDGVPDVPAFGTNAFAVRRIRSVLPGGGSIVPSGMIDPYGAHSAGLHVRRRIAEKSD